MEDSKLDADEMVGTEHEASQTDEHLSDYERYCREQADMWMDELGDDRCFGEMAEGQFVRGH